MTAPQLIDLNPYIAGVRSFELLPWTGEVVELVGLLVASRGPAVAVGDFCEVVTSTGRRIRTQVIGFRDDHVLSMPLEEIDGIQLHDRIIARREDAQVAVGPDLVGRVLDGFGKPLDRGSPIRPAASYRLYQPPGSPLDREHIVNPIATGIRAIDTLIPVGTGQRMGIFGGSGVGKEHLAGRHGAPQLRGRHRDRTHRGAQSRSARLPRSRSRSRGPRALGGGLLHVRPARSAARPGMLRGPRRCRVLPRPGGQRPVDHGFGYAPRHGAARNRAGGGRAAQPEGIHALGFQPAAQNPRARRQFSERLHHRLLHGPGRGRRFQRAGVRCGARHSGWPHHPVAPPGGRRALSRHRRDALGEPPGAAAFLAGAHGRGPQTARGDGDLRRNRRT